MSTGFVSGLACLPWESQNTTQPKSGVQKWSQMDLSFRAFKVFKPVSNGFE
jgi:hypothetical protein